MLPEYELQPLHTSAPEIVAVPGDAALYCYWGSRRARHRNTLTVYTRLNDHLRAYTS